MLKIKKNNTVLKLLLVIVVIGSVYLIGRWEFNDFKKKISENPAFTTGIIKEVEYKGKRGFVVTYSFEVDSRFYTSDVNGGRYRGVRNVIKGKTFPVIYNGKSPEINAMMIVPDDFEDYDVQFPDSLFWIRKYID